MKLQISLEVIISILVSLLIALCISSFLLGATTTYNNYLKLENGSSREAGSYVSELSKFCKCFVNQVYV